MKEVTDEKYLDEHRNFRSLKDMGETVEVPIYKWFVCYAVHLPVSIMLWSLFLVYGYFNRMSERIYRDTIWNPASITLETRIKYEFSVLTAKSIRSVFIFLRSLFMPVENYINNSRSSSF